MKKAIKIVLLSVVCLVLVVIVAGYVALTQIDFNNYKSLIVKTVKDATGREIVIGDIKVKPSFIPVISVSDVSFSNAAWAKNMEMVKAEEVGLSVSVIPLLSNNFVINNFVIRNAEVNLEESAKNGSNWNFEKDVVEKVEDNKISFDFELIKSANAQEKNSGAGFLSSVVIKKVSLDNVKINYTDKNNKTQTYDVNNLKLSENSKDNIDFDFVVNNGEYKGKGELGALKLLDASNGYPVIADVDVKGIKAVVDMTLLDAMGDVQFYGKAKVLNFMGQSGLDDSLQIDYKGDLKNVVVAIRELSVAGNVVKGEIECALDGKIPSIKANLVSPKINIDSFAKKEKTALLEYVIKNANATSLVGNESIAYNDFYVVNADVDVEIAKIVNNRGTIIDNLATNVSLKDGVAKVDVKKANIFGGKLLGNAQLKAKNHQLDVDMSANKLSLFNLVKVLGGETSGIEFFEGGITDIAVKLKSVGNSCNELVENLDGNMVVIVDKSKFSLGNIGKMKGNIVSQLLNTLDVSENKDDLNMSCAVVRADFGDKKIKFPDGIVLNADKLTLVADGDINLKNDGLSISIKPFAGKLTDTNIAKALSSLVKLSGTIQNPKISVDSANAIKTIVGVTAGGPVYLGTQMLLESDGSPCYTALKGTGYENRFPEPKNVVYSTGEDVGKILNDSVGSVKDATKGIMNFLSGGFNQKNESK